MRRERRWKGSNRREKDEGGERGRLKRTDENHPEITGKGEEKKEGVTSLRKNDGKDRGDGARPKEFRFFD